MGIDFYGTDEIREELGVELKEISSLLKKTNKLLEKIYDKMLG